MPCLTYRALDYNFLSTHRTAFESGKLGHLSNKYAGGFMVWRRTLLMPVAVMYCISVLIDIYVVVNTYRVQPAVFVRDFVGEMLWNTVFCPHKPCKAVRGLEPIHTVLLCTDATLAAVGLFAAYKMAQGARHWATYRLSSRHLRVAFAALFVAPFALFLALPPAQFIQVDFVQSTLCEEKMKSLAKGLPPQALPPVLWEFCREDISAWEAAFNQSLVDQGRLRNPRTGTCPAAVTDARRARGLRGQRQGMHRQRRGLRQPGARVVRAGGGARPLHVRQHTVARRHHGGVPGLVPALPRRPVRGPEQRL